MRPSARLLSAVLLLQPLMLFATTSDTVLWFDAPATHFTESCPIGNGRLGAMVFGGIDEERIVLNENGLWSGSRQEADRPDGAASLPEIRRLLLEGKNVEAEELVNKSFTCLGKGTGFGSGANVPFGCYQTLGNLRLRQLFSTNAAPATAYRRELDLGSAVTVTEFERGGVRYAREAFVSAPDNALLIRLSASRPGALSFDISMDRAERASVAGETGALLMSGTLNDGNGGKGVSFAALLRHRVTGGTVTLEGGVLKVREADEVELRLSAASDIDTFAGRRLKDAVAGARSDLEACEKKSYVDVRRAHVADYRAYFGRCSLALQGAEPVSVAALSTPARLKAFAEGGADASLPVLYFNFGRYLLISSSRPGGLPANLQGIWAEEIQTPWNGDWHLNVNVQMNYWPAEVTGLGDLHEPLFSLTNSLVAPGARTAQAYYKARGWVAHVVTNPWGFTSPAESAAWGATTTGSAWLCQHLWDHYLFTGDVEYLRKVWPALSGSARFYADMLVEDPRSGRLLTAPSNSPENAFVMADGRKAHICLGSTSDMQMVRHLFEATIAASRILKMDTPFSAELSALLPRLAPTRAGSDGRIMEWQEEYKEADPHHRHISHLWGLYPGTEISPSTPELLAAARKTLEVRGDAGTGWSLAFKLNLWARLGDGERSYQILREHLKPANRGTERKQWSGGTYANLFDAHPPFQIDGNFGGAAGIAEMLLQSAPGELKLLPALPSAWPSGSVRAFRARGGYTVDLTWEKGALKSARLERSTAMVAADASTQVLRLRLGARVIERTIPVSAPFTMELSTADFASN